MHRLRSPQGRDEAPARVGHRVLPSIFAGVGFALLLLVPAVPAAAASWRFEAEDINPSSCHAGAGGIGVVTCSDASGGHALEGFTTLGDWAEVSVTFDRETCFIDSIRCASPLQSSWQFLIEFRSEGSPNSVVARSEHAGVTGRGIT
jgi:hypothetical protein